MWTEDGGQCRCKSRCGRQCQFGIRKNHSSADCQGREEDWSKTKQETEKTMTEDGAELIHRQKGKLWWIKISKKVSHSECSKMCNAYLSNSKHIQLRLWALKFHLLKKMRVFTGRSVRSGRSGLELSTSKLFEAATSQGFLLRRSAASADIPGLQVDELEMSWNFAQCFADLFWM